MQQINPHNKLLSFVETLLIYLPQPINFDMCTTTIPHLNQGITKSIPSSSINTIEVAVKYNVTYVHDCPTMEICCNVDTSSKVMVISPVERWKVLVS